MKKPLIQNIKIAAKEEGVCYMWGLCRCLSNLFGWWDGGMAKTSVVLDLESAHSSLTASTTRKLRRKLVTPARKPLECHALRTPTFVPRTPPVPSCPAKGQTMKKSIRL